MNGNAYGPAEGEPTPRMLRIAEPFGAELGPFAIAEDIRSSLRYRVKKSAEDPVKAEQILRDAGAPFSPDAKPEELVKGLEETAVKLEK